jgi:uncharacterized protein YfaP (DUF2135 family)
LPLSRSTRSIVYRLRLVMLLVTLLSLFAMDLAQPSPGHAKEFDVIGTVDCGIPSGRRCDLGDTLVLLTDSVSGLNELVRIDIRGIKRKLPALDQDDEIALCVELLPDGKLKATCVISAKRRDGLLNQGASTGSVDVTESRRDRGLEQDNDEQPDTTSVTLPQQPQPGVSGVVRSLVTGAPIPGATVILNGFTANTDAAGAFNIVGIPPGTYQATASAPGFIPQTQTVTVPTTQTTQVNFALATAFPNLNFTVVWGAQPPDLDAHLSGPGTAQPPRFHVFFLNPNPETYASLTIDDTDGFGPERIVVTPNPATGQYVAGDYHFWVDNPNAAVGPNFSGSQARVIVNLDAQLLGVFDIANAAGDPNLRLWHVVNVQLTAGGAVTVQPVQQFTSGGSVTVLAPPYGPKPPRR